ncbi:hypothetical protein J5N97_002359 [Dioscorea zingiberensis]|uniref:Factor of DNA methylation 1-5/IDN2 domain-containing protein n=1 Tax=Dioscorea zingiberensis TaxID=325984 RepID=A0A9D5HPD9_9LILI|nr:hypothetical protein J5N97_002359 [Dioscorea zingiberensis]
MQRDQDQRKKLDLELQVAELQGVLEREQRLNRFLRFAMHEPLVSHSCHSCLSSVIPLQLQVLLAELAIVEQEIICLERRVEDLKLCLFQERKQQNNYFCFLGRNSQEPVSLILNRNVTIQSHQDEEKVIGTPNKISEELIKNLISIFHKLRRPGNRLDCEITTVSKLSISCINSIISCKSDPMQVLGIDGAARNIGLYKNCVQLTRNSFDMSRIHLCVADIARVQILIDKLRDIELNCMTNKQKLAFWINIYNASIMHAFLQHGLPLSSEKLLALLNKAAVNVGGIVLNALAIEHFILRNSSMDEKEATLWRKYGLGYPEPNVTFALCRGNWSSPALRVYTAEDVVNELERAKVDLFMEAEQAEELYKLVRRLIQEVYAKNERLRVLEGKCDDLSSSLRRAVEEKDKLNQAHLAENERLKLEVDSLRKELERRETEMKDVDIKDLFVKSNQRTAGGYSQELKNLEHHDDLIVKKNEFIGEQQDIEEFLNTLILKERMANSELQETRAELMIGLKGMLSSRSVIGIKRMGQLNDKPFRDACLQRFPNEEAEMEYARLCSLWQENICDSRWHPFKIAMINGKPQQILDDDDEKLQGLKNKWGEEAYEAVVTALMEMNDYNASARYAVPELWNNKEGRRASLKEMGDKISPS